MFSRFSGYRLICIFGLLLIIGVWLTVWKQCAVEYDRVMEEAYREEMNLARVYEQHVRSVFQDADRTLLALREAYLQEGLSGPKFQIILSQANGEFARTQIGFTDPQGMVHSLLQKNFSPYDVSDRDYFIALRDMKADRIFVGKTIIGRKSNELLIPVGRRITNPDGSFGGIIVTGISASYLRDSFHSMELGPGKLISVTGLDGVTRIRQGADITAQAIDVSSGAVYQSVRSHPSGTVRAPNVADGLIRLNAYRALPEYSVYINVAMAEQDVLQNYVKRKTTYLGAASFATLFITVFCGLLIRRNIKQRKLEVRLLTLQETTRRLLTDSVDIEGLLQTIVQDALRLVGAPNGLIATVSPDGSEWTVRRGVGIQEQRVGEHRPVSDGLIGKVITGGELIYAPEYSRYPTRLLGSRFDNLKSVIGMPLKVGDKVVGALMAEWDYIIPDPHKELLDTLCQYGQLASVALERTNSQNEILRVALTDTLTGLPNRRSIYNRLTDEMERARRSEAHGAVLFIDLDNLKLVNDTVGHSYGDFLIREASRTIAKESPQDSFVGRLAGDEFIVLVPCFKDRQELMDIADRLIQSLDHQYDWEGTSVHVTATAGIALFPENGNTVEDILKNADAALYAAKETGKRAWQFYDASIQEHIREKVLLANRLLQALEGKELSLHYQPVMTNDGIPVGFEALLRWNSPEYGPVPPARFIPIAEQSRLIQPIGTWVLQEACRFARRLADMGRGDLWVNVNVSVLQLEMEDFCDIVTEALKAAGIEPGQLGIEITESAFMESVEASADQLSYLQIMGVKVSLDDFGEGYSSLAKLLQLPVDTLKISRTLINMLGADHRQMSFVASIVEMAHAAGLTVVAEGVETQEQLTHVIGCRCDWTQGYYFFRPVPEEDALEIISSYNSADSVG